MNIGKLIKTALPIFIAGATGGASGGLGSLFGGIESPFLRKAIIGGLTSKAFGAKNKDALKTGLLAGGLGALFGDGSQATTTAGANAKNALPSGSKGVGQFLDNRGGNEAAARIMTSKPPIEQAVQNIQGVSPRTFSGELLKSAGIGDDNLLARLLNTRMGEGLTAGLIAQLLAGGDDDEQPREFEQRPFGFGGPGGRLGGITFAADGGPMSFPRRNGGIDPSEGSGTKDDVPAMLMAGEFVLTKDAVKGLGGGNQRKGIQRAYNMMDNLEARA
tara:strand:+ start:318 stop:1139 length:822 start_codon:yes stop_codon:yes gene_type:complete